MKKIAAVLMLFSNISFLSAQTLTWDASVSNDVERYRVYWGGESRRYSFIADAGSGLDYSVNGFGSMPRYFFTVTSIDSGGSESIYGNEVAWDSPFYEPPPQNSDSTVWWAHDKNIAALLIYERKDTSGAELDPILVVEWWQKSALNDRGWRPLVFRNADSTDYWIRGDTLVLNTIRLRKYNKLQANATEYDYSWKLRAELVNPQAPALSSPWAYTAKWVRLVAPDVTMPETGMPRPILIFKFIEEGGSN